MKIKTLKELKKKDGSEIIPAGTEVDVRFDVVQVPLVTGGTMDRDVMIVTTPKGFETKCRLWTSFFKRPTNKTLERWAMDSVCKSVTGKKCEPDGHSDDGAPSWLLALGFI